MKKHSIISPLLIFLAGSLWGSMGLFVRKLSTVSLSSMDMITIGKGLAVICFGLYMLIFDRSLFKIKLKDLWCFLGTGILSIFFFSLCYFTTITLTSLSVAAILLYTAPVFVIVLSRIFFKEKLSPNKIIALVLTLTGLVFVTGVLSGAEGLSPKTVLIGLGAGLGYALYSIFSHCAIERGYKSVTITFYTFLIATIATVPFANWTIINTQLIKSAPLLLFAVAFSIVGTVLPYLFYTAGLKHTENGTASIIASVEPVVATLIGFFVYKENLSVQEIVGVVLVLVGIVVCNVRGKE